MADEASPAAEQAEAVQAMTAEFRAVAVKAWAAVSALEAAILARWPSLARSGRRTAAGALEKAVQAQAAEVVAAAKGLRVTIEVIGQRGAAAAALAAGRSGPTIGTHPAVTAIAGDTYADVLAATQNMTQTAKELTRRLARDRIGDKLAEGETPAQAARKLAADMADHRIAAVIYADGSRHGLAEYSEMLARTKAAEAYQEAGFLQTEELGIEYVELFDGIGCGLSSHQDPRKANGLILTVEEARRYVLSHPRCRRCSSPRPGVTDPSTAKPIGPQHSAAEIAAASTRPAVATSPAAQRAAARSVAPVGLSAAQQRAQRRVARRTGTGATA